MGELLGGGKSNYYFELLKVFRDEDCGVIHFGNHCTISVEIRELDISISLYFLLEF
jgi:hypothetical protein